MSSLKDMQNSARAAVEHEDPTADPRGTPPRGGVDRTKSGGSRAMMSRRPPGRSKSHKIGRPTFSTEELPPEPNRGVNRAKSGRLRSAPNRSGSFGRSAPDRGASSGSLKGRRQAGTSSENGDDLSISDSVFTSASNQTLDSIALRKKQFAPSDAKTGMMRMPSRSVDHPDFDDQSLLTVDSIPVHHRHVDSAGDAVEGDMSVFSESFVSEGSYDDDFSDYADEDGVNMQEVEYEFEEGLSLDDKALTEEAEEYDDAGAKH